MAETQEQKEYVVALDEKGNPVAVSADLAKYNGYQVVKGGFSSPGEAQSAISTQSPVDVGVQQATNPPDRRVFDYGSPGIEAQQGQERNNAAQVEALAKIAWPNGGMAAPIEGSPESVAFSPGGSQPGGAPYVPQRRPSAVEAYQPATNPVDIYDPNNIFEGTWANGNVDQNMLLNIISGKVTPDIAVDQVLNAQGMDSSTNRAILEQMYGSYGDINSMANPGALPLTPDEYYGQAGDFTTQMNSNAGPGLSMVDEGALWDNQFSRAYSDQVGGMVEGQANPEEMQKDMVVNNIGALSPYMGPERAAVLQNQVEQEYVEYMSGGQNQNMSFIEYLRARGAADWA
jgi:hypothetical protein